MNPPLARRIRELDWRRIRTDLDVQGHAVAGPLFDAAESRALDALWDSARFRSEIHMGPRRYGQGVYRYFAAPLPAAVRTLRQQLYARLAPVANAWWRRLGREPTFPARLRPFLSQCHEAGQRRPTPLLLRYERDGYNCLHQDRYGRVAFPLQAALLLSRPGRDFEGGEFLLVEQRPRAQSRGEAIGLRQGELIVFPNAERPVEGSRGSYRAAVRHGVSRVREGRRATLGIIFHDAE
jgi:hypothetical protein